MAQKKKVREIFRRADSNGDGKLDLDEFMDHFKAQGVNMTRQEAQLLFKEKDRDQDNFIGLEEFLGEATETEKVWKALDGNKNGGLSREELQTGLKKYKKSLPGSITRGHFLEKANEAFAAKRRAKQQEILSYDEFCHMMQTT